MATEPPAPHEDDEPVEAAPDRPASARTALIASCIIAVLVALLVVVLANGEPSTERATQSPLLGQLAPETAGVTLDGDRVSIDEHRGRWVIVNFFASWCVPCRTEHPELIDFHERHRAIGDAVVVGVTFDNESDDARAFFAEHGGDWPVIDDPQNSIAVAYGVAQVPETFVVAPDGTVVQRLIGGVTAAQLDALLAQYEAPA